MEDYFSTHSDQIKKRPEAMEVISLGLPCCSVYESELFRATVKFVDYGNEEVVRLEEVYELEKKNVELCLGAVC